MHVTKVCLTTWPYTHVPNRKQEEVVERTPEEKKKDLERLEAIRKKR